MEYVDCIHKMLLKKIVRNFFMVHLIKMRFSGNLQQVYAFWNFEQYSNKTPLTIQTNTQIVRILILLLRFNSLFIICAYEQLHF